MLVVLRKKMCNMVCQINVCIFFLNPLKITKKYFVPFSHFLALNHVYLFLDIKTFQTHIDPVTGLPWQLCDQSHPGVLFPSYIVQIPNIHSPPGGCSPWCPPHCLHQYSQRKTLLIRLCPCRRHRTKTN